MLDVFFILLPISLFTAITFVFLSKNPVYGVLSFVLVVGHVVVLLILLDLEFLAYILAIVYIGAIVVLFLFVIMMFYIYPFNWKRTTLKTIIEYYFLGVLSSYSLHYFMAVTTGSSYTDFNSIIYTRNLLTLLARYFFNEGAILTVLAALIMFVGIIGAILLTLKTNVPLTAPILIQSPKNRSNVIASIDKII